MKMSCAIGSLSLNGRVEITGRILDSDNGEPLPGASVQVVNAAGQQLGDGVAADNDGYFRLNSAIFTGNYLAISNVGYHSIMLDPAGLNSYNTIDLEPNYNELDPVIITPGKKNNTWLWLLLIGGGIYIASK